MTSPQYDVGMVGLGLLGSALAERALSAGRTVSGYDVASERGICLRQQGGVPLASAADVVRHSDIVCLALPHGGIVREVLEAVREELRPGMIVVDVTTGAPDVMAETGELLHARGIGYLDATISGSSEQVRRGEALFMVGGAPEVVERVTELLSALARQTRHVGPCGYGARMKLVTNLVLGLNRAALAEGLVLAERLGLELPATLAVLQESAAYSRAMDTKGKKMIDGDFTPQARLSQHLKDVRLMLAAAQQVQQALPLSEAHRQLLEWAESRGLGGLDNSAVFQALKQLGPSPE